MTDTIEKDSASEKKCSDRVKESEVEKKDAVNASPSPDANWMKSRADWVRSKNKQSGVQEGHVVEYSTGCDTESY
ncbi:hypothetical protein ACFL7E_03495 [Thermodesulfobacteriota bacterium]